MLKKKLFTTWMIKNFQSQQVCQIFSGSSLLQVRIVLHFSVYSVYSLPLWITSTPTVDSFKSRPKTNIYILYKLLNPPDLYRLLVFLCWYFSKLLIFRFFVTCVSLIQRFCASVSCFKMCFKNQINLNLMSFCTHLYCQWTGLSVMSEIGKE